MKAKPCAMNITTADQAFVVLDLCIMRNMHPTKRNPMVFDIRAMPRDELEILLDDNDLMIDFKFETQAHIYFKERY